MPAQNVIGAFEDVSFPEFMSGVVTAKIDTGAYTGAVHCSRIEEKDIEGGKTLCFSPLNSATEIQKDNFIAKYVRSSNGRRQKRYFIATHIMVQGQQFEITLSLTDRAGMRWPVLIGRRFLKQNNFLIDPSRIKLYPKQAL